MASDLKRVALGLERQSLAMAERFFQEALKRKDEINLSHLPDYLDKIIRKISVINLRNLSEDSERVAEDCLMYSTLLQNFTRR